VQFGTIAPSLLQVSGLGAVHFSHQPWCGRADFGYPVIVERRRLSASALVISAQIPMPHADVIR
jgi:hypothetical protein